MSGWENFSVPAGLSAFDVNMPPTKCPLDNDSGRKTVRSPNVSWSATDLLSLGDKGARVGSTGLSEHATTANVAARARGREMRMRTSGAGLLARWSGCDLMLGV